MDNLTRLPVTELKGVGAVVAEKLARIGIETVQDLLFHLPRRYEDRTRLTPMGAVRPGDKVLVQGQIQTVEVSVRGRRILRCVVSDSSGRIECRFFHFSAAQSNNMQPGIQMRLFGEVRAGRHALEMVHPEYRIFEPDAAPELDSTLTALYPVTEGLHQKRIQALVAQALCMSGPEVLHELLPAELLRQEDCPDLYQTLKYLHTPGPEVALTELQQDSNPALKRLALEELLAHQVSMKRLRLRKRRELAGACRGHGYQQKLLAALPFELTAAQRRVSREIAQDLQTSIPMMRLVQGDVGCGKTLVAAMAALQVIEAGYQVALMVPTEILSEQHAKSFRSWFEPLGLSVEWLAGKHKGKARRATLTAIAEGAARMIIGTHALFQKEVEFNRLGLVIVDEQHRFGVHQRLALRQKALAPETGPGTTTPKTPRGRVPHQLIMTATPIPRTLAMTAYADLDTSVIDALPPGRIPVQTLLVSDQRRDEVITRIAQACGDARQVYWVCTLINESEALQCQAAETTAELLTRQLESIRVGLVHGRMPSAEKERIMTAFKAGEIQLLVATTVIEVGVDVPNASLMVIENPERLGLAQLHQLRGRVGRGTTQSHCLLLYHAPLSPQGQIRLKIMRQTNDGFRIAEEDLKLRGPGEVLGTRQTGIAAFKIADLIRDQALIPSASHWAEVILRDYPQRVEPLIRRWLYTAEQYADA